MRSIVTRLAPKVFARLGPLGTFVVLAWLAFAWFSLFKIGGLVRLYESVDWIREIERSSFSAWCLWLCEVGYWLAPIPILFVWWRPKSTPYYVVNVALVLVPLVAAYVTYMHAYDIAEALGAPPGTPLPVGW